MKVFVRVAECRNFSRAAESLDLANATVTTCVRNLEKHLGVTLIDRNTRRLHLTEEGTLFLDRARVILRSIEDAEAEAQTRGGELRGMLRIEMPISIGRALFGAALPRFAARYPGLSLSVTLANKPYHVVESGTDVAIRMDRVEDESLVARPLYETHYVVCCARDVAPGLPSDPARLDPRMCLGVLAEDHGAPNAWRLQRGERSVSIRPGGPLHYNSSDALLQALAAGSGVGHVLDIFAAPLLASGELVRLFPDWTTTSKTFYAVMAKHRASAAKVRVFIDFLGEVLRAERRPASSRRIGVRSLAAR